MDEQVGQTLAISAQVLPASRIALSLCSSSAVHGVFVRPFFFPGGGGAGVASGAAAIGVWAAAGAASPSIGPPREGGGMVPIAGCCKDARRFLGFVGGGIWTV